MKQKKVTRQMALDAAAEVGMRMSLVEREYRGALLLNYILLKRNGGIAIVTINEMKDVEKNKGGIRIDTDPETGDYTFRSFEMAKGLPKIEVVGG